MLLSMGNTKILCFGICVFLSLGVLIREYSITSHETQFFMAQDVFVARVQGAPDLIVGDNSWFLPLIKSRFSSWIWRHKIWMNSDFETGKLYVWGDGFVARVLDNLMILDTGEHRFILFLGEGDLDEALSLAVDYESDFWVVWNSTFISRFPNPKEGIVILTGRNPTKSWQEFSSKQQIPLIGLESESVLEMSYREEEWKILFE